MSIYYKISDQIWDEVFIIPENGEIFKTDIDKLRDEIEKLYETENHPSRLRVWFQACQIASEILLDKRSQNPIHMHKKSDNLFFQSVLLDSYVSILGNPEGII